MVGGIGPGREDLFSFKMNSETPAFSLPPLWLLTYREATVWVLPEGSMLPCLTEKGEGILRCLSLLESYFSFLWKPWEIHTFLITPKVSE